MLTRADCTTRNKRKADRLRRIYDELEARIDRLAEEEELASLRPDLDGNQIMTILGLPPGREVGEAYRHLLELRMDHGPMSQEQATAALVQLVERPTGHLATTCAGPSGVTWPLSPRSGRRRARCRRRRTPVR